MRGAASFPFKTFRLSIKEKVLKALQGKLQFFFCRAPNGHHEKKVKTGLKRVSKIFNNNHRYDSQSCFLSFLYILLEDNIGEFTK